LLGELWGMLCCRALEISSVKALAWRKVSLEWVSQPLWLQLPPLVLQAWLLLSCPIFPWEVFKSNDRMTGAIGTSRCGRQLKTTFRLDTIAAKVRRRLSTLEH
jgi:hypothetical protein